jgi:hypothetical protein
VKRISFEDYKRFFQEVVNNVEVSTAVFYALGPSSLTFSFNSPGTPFIIECEVPYSDIVSMYSEAGVETSVDVLLKDSGEHPFIQKFVLEYLNQRGIREL